VNELELVRWIRARGHGIGDDCVVLPGGRGNDLLVTTDMLIEDVHFRRPDPPALLGHRALARGLSDIAAMGGTPRWCLLSLALAPWCTTAWTRRFFEGLLALARQHRTKLVGGDTSHANQLTADIIVMGQTPHGEALLRSGARPGDGIYVSGVLGGAPKKFEPRLALGRFLRPRATACMDLSDGLSLDLHRLCLESRTAAVIDRPLPVAPGATLEQAMHHGEDYELLFTARTAPPRSHKGVPITRAGTIVRGPAGRIELFGQRHVPRGYDHLNRSTPQ
jgi:thiamine-monophosphate kinase